MSQPNINLLFSIVLFLIAQFSAINFAVLLRRVKKLEDANKVKED